MSVKRFIDRALLAGDRVADNMADLVFVVFK